MNIIIFGGTGQFGYHLTNKYKKNNKIYIFSRSNTSNKKFYQNKNIRTIKYNYKNIEHKLKKINPRVIFYCSGQSSVSKSFTHIRETMRSNYFLCFSILKILKKINSSAKFVNFNSIEIFGNQPNTINLNSDFNPCSPYAYAKMQSFIITKFYREFYNLKAYNLILSNSVSIEGNKKFVFLKILSSAIKSYKYNKKKIPFGNITIMKDWCYMPEIVNGISKFIAKKPDDIILASGKSIKLINLLKYAYCSLGLDYRNYIIFTKNLIRNNDTNFFKIDTKNMIKKINCKPKKNIFKVIDIGLKTLSKKI